jgi:hypothetical protein
MNCGIVGLLLELRSSSASTGSRKYPKGLNIALIVAGCSQGAGSSPRIIDIVCRKPFVLHSSGWYVL